MFHRTVTPIGLGVKILSVINKMTGLGVRNRFCNKNDDRQRCENPFCDQQDDRHRCENPFCDQQNYRHRCEKSIL